MTARGVSWAGSSSARWSELGMAGAKPATAMDNLAATPRVPRDNTESAAPVVDTGNVQATPQAEAALVNAVNVASAVKQIAPQRVTRSSRTDVEHATAAASNELAVDGPPGTARKPATAANTTAMTLSVTQRIGSGWARRMATAPIAAAAAMTPPVMTCAGRVGDDAGPHQRRRAEHGRAQACRSRREPCWRTAGVSGVDHRVPWIVFGSIAAPGRRRS